VLCVVIELRTDLIMDAVTIPAALYFLIANLVAGPKPARAYLLAIGIPTLFVILGIVISRRFGRGEKIGMGAVKLILVTSVALGGVEAFLAAVVFAVLAILTVAITRKTDVPSSPLITAAVVSTLLARSLYPG